MNKREQQLSEIACEHYCREVLGCVRTVRAVRTRFARQDLFAADCIGKRQDGSSVYVQVTTGTSANVAQRRRKLEAVPWQASDTVKLLEMRKPSRGKRVFRVHRYFFSEGIWQVSDELIDIPKHWCKAWKED